MSTKPRLFLLHEICSCCGARNYYLVTEGETPSYFENKNGELVKRPFKSIFTTPDDAMFAANAMGYNVFDDKDRILI
jgi:hypothetical protein